MAQKQHPNLPVPINPRGFPRLSGVLERCAKHSAEFGSVSLSLLALSWLIGSQKPTRLPALGQCGEGPRNGRARVTLLRHVAMGATKFTVQYVLDTCLAHVPSRGSSVFPGAILQDSPLPQLQQRREPSPSFLRDPRSRGRVTVASASADTPTTIKAKLLGFVPCRAEQLLTAGIGRPTGSSEPVATSTRRVRLNMSSRFSGTDDVD